MDGAASFVRNGFAAHYGASPEVRLFRAPGRVNLIGEHTDYSDGFVLPIAIEFACYVAAAPNPDGRLHVWSENLRQAREWPLDELARLRPAGDWSDYVVGVAQQLLSGGHRLAPRNLLIWSDVPIGSGLSSSAALEVSSALALSYPAAIDRVELAQLCRRAEADFVGLPCGIMDQYVSVFGQAGAAVKIDCRSLKFETVALPSGVAVMAVNSMVKHELGASAYRDRVRECAEAVSAIRKRYPSVTKLRDVSGPQLSECAHLIPPVPLRRARHVVTEDERVEDFLEACRAADLAAMGELFTASHRSLQHDFEVSCAELDCLVDEALKIDGVYGARMTGGGFGGCTVNLVAPEKVDQFEKTLGDAYQAAFRITPQFYRCQPSAGAGELV
jgi:galactokinase